MTDADRVAVADLLERFRDAWERMDADAACACFEEGPETIVIGTDANEFWRGHEALVEPFQAMSTAFDHAEYAWGPGDPTVDLAGDAALAAGVLNAAFDTPTGRTAMSMRMTGAARRQPDGTWRFRQAHFSVAAAEPTEY